MTPDIRMRITQLRHGIVPEGYHKTESGIVPTDWQRFSMGDIYTERKEAGNDALPILSVSIHSGVSDGALDEDELGKKVKRIEDKSQYRKALSGDLVFNMMRAWQGAIGVVRTDGMVSPAYIVATPNDKVYPPFMDYYMKKPRMINAIHSQSYGVTDFRLRLYWDSFAPIRCTLPPLPEQQKIAAILSAQDKVIELKEKRLAQKQRQKKYLMQQLLTGKKRLDGFEEEWIYTRIGSVCVINPKPENHADKEVAFLGMSDVSDSGQIVKQNLVEYEAVKSGYTAFKRGDVLVAKITPCFENGKGAITDSLLTLYGCGSTEFHVLRCHRMMLNRYLFYHTQSDSFRKRLEAEMVGTAGQKRVQSNSISLYGLWLPGIKEQRAITGILFVADHEISLLQQDIDQEKQKKKALMQLLLMGIVRVNV